MKNFIYLFTFCFLLLAFSLNAQEQFPDSSFDKVFPTDPTGGWREQTGYNGKYWDFKTSKFNTLNEIYARDNNPPADLTAFRVGKAYHGPYCIKLVSGRIVLKSSVFLPGVVGTLNPDFIEEFLQNDSASVTVKTDWFGNPTPSALEGWYKYYPINSDSARIEIGFYYLPTDKEPAFLEKIIIKDATDTTVNGWQRFSVPIPERYWNEEFSNIRTLFISSAKINWDNLMKCDGQRGSTLWIDNIELKYPGQDIKQNLMSSLKPYLFPNPASEVLNIELNEDFHGKFVVYNMNGSKMLEEKINGTKHQVNITDLATGNYVYRLIKENTIQAQGKFVVTK